MEYIKAAAELLNELNLASVTFRILLAALVGGSIGLERGRHGRAAGLRTHILVCLGATVAAMVGLYTTQILGSGGDPMRIGAQVISGIGFLGAGTILTQPRSHVTGLTTAAGLWTTASLGLAIGVGFYWAVVAAFLVVRVTMSKLIRLELSVKNENMCGYYLELTDILRTNEFFARYGETFTELRIIPAKSGIQTHIGLCGVLMDEDAAAMEEIQELEYVAICVPEAK